jgi:hypothetical protein
MPCVRWEEAFSRPCLPSQVSLPVSVPGLPSLHTPHTLILFPTLNQSPTVESAWYSKGLQRKRPLDQHSICFPKLWSLWGSRLPLDSCMPWNSNYCHDRSSPCCPYFFLTNWNSFIYSYLISSCCFYISYLLWSRVLILLSSTEPDPWGCFDSSEYRFDNIVFNQVTDKEGIKRT